jgi:hypothetical protein
MQLIAAHNGKLLTLNPNGSAEAGRSFSSGLAGWDTIAPGGDFARGAIHELLTHPSDGKAMFAAMVLALGGEGMGMKEKGRRDGGTNGLRDEGTEGRRVETKGLSIGVQDTDFASCPFVPPSLSPSVPSSADSPDHPSVPSSLSPLVPPSTNFPSSAIIWIDPAHELYPPALAAHGFPLDRLFLLQPKLPDPKGKSLLWAIGECLRCKGVSAVVAAPPRLSRIAARRLQLAAEQGGGAGIFLRHVGQNSAFHAAASRWLIRPAPGARNLQRWTIQLIHGHGGRVGQTLCLEHCRETNHVRTFDPMADRPLAEKSIAS